MAIARIDLAGLQQDINQFKNKFEGWVAETSTDADLLRDNHISTLRELQGSIRALLQKQDELKKKAKEVESRLSQEATEIEDLKTILSKVKAEQQALPPLIEELLSNLEYEEQRYEARHAALQDEEAVKHRKLEALRQAVVYYRDRLALTIETLVQVTEDNVYKVVGCTPNVVSLPKLLANLNTGSIEFCDFVRAMRQEFKAIVQKEEMTSSS